MKSLSRVRLQWQLKRGAHEFPHCSLRGITLFFLIFSQFLKILFSFSLWILKAVEVVGIEMMWNFVYYTFIINFKHFFFCYWSVGYLYEIYLTVNVKHVLKK